jgi:lactoylglutathione lyase
MEDQAKHCVRVDHVALWVRDLERARAFYVERLGGRSGPLYQNPRSGLRSYFVWFGEGARIELMSRDDVGPAPGGETPAGYAHVALSVGSRSAVDALVVALERAGFAVAGRPRTTGDGYYEAGVLDPEGNRIEITG